MATQVPFLFLFFLVLVIEYYLTPFGEDQVMAWSDDGSLGTWLLEYDRLHALTFRVVTLTAVGIMVQAPTIGSPRSLRRRARTTRFRGWRPSHISYVMGNTFRPSAAYRATPDSIAQARRLSPPLKNARLPSSLPRLPRRMIGRRRALPRSRPLLQLNFGTVEELASF
jgi:hypothetical protein